MTEQIKRCPYCDELIRANAIKCKHCSSMLTDAPTTGATSVSNPETLIRLALGDKYEIGEVVGRGGMATVYRAVQKNLNRTVALKVIHQNLVHDTEFVARFIREAQVSASLSHPNIVTVYDAGSLGSVHYMVMEYLDGEDLHQKVNREGSLREAEVKEWAMKISNALDHIHNKGLLHRDIKSSNIFITTEGRPVLMDFGIAHAANGTKLTQTGTIIGTPEYMSPEQAQGKPMDARSDLYSLGIILYECLTGCVPFKGDNPLTTIHKVIYEIPASIQFINPTVSIQFDEIIKKLLTKESGSRFQSSLDLWRALEHKSVLQTYDLNTNVENLETRKIETSPNQKLIVNYNTKPKNQNSFSSSGLLKKLGLVFIEGGKFLMGDNHGETDEIPAHEVDLDSFYIGKYAFSEGQLFKIYPDLMDCINTEFPLVGIRFQEVITLINVLNEKSGMNFRLPTEAEWEFAAKGGIFSKNYIYSGSNSINDVAWYNRNSNNKIQKNGLKAPNELGLYDMSGNAFEWCSDIYSSKYYSKSAYKNPKGPLEGNSHVIRGGSFAYNENFCRSAYRIEWEEEDDCYDIGFRLVHDYPIKCKI
jgi:serine/threonine protein kinase